MGWRPTVATIRMQLQVFALVLRSRKTSLNQDFPQSRLLLNQGFAQSRLPSIMASLYAVSIAILLGAVLVMARMLSSPLALRFGAPLRLVFLLIVMLAGGSSPC